MEETIERGRFEERERYPSRPQDAGLELIQIAPPSDAFWPRAVSGEARIGLSGEFLQSVEPLTEADPSAILIHFLSAVGNLLGNHPHLLLGESRHPLRIWAVVVGSTATGRKGTAANLVFSLLDQVEPAWVSCRKAGIASGEAIVHHIRDDDVSVRRVCQARGEVQEIAETIEGVRDKRLLLLEEEFSRVLRISRKEGTTLSATIREAWDRDTLMTTAKTARERTTGAHVTIVGHITPEELRRELSPGEVSCGFANRFLFATSRRSKRLSFPLRIPASIREALVVKLSRVKEWVDGLGEGRSEIQIAPASRTLWEQMKPEIEDEAERAEAAGFILGKVITRGAPYVLRLSALYAVLDRSLEIEPQHLRAAGEVWRYSVDSARAIFGDEVSSPDARRVITALLEARDRSLTRLQVYEALGRHRSAEEVTRLRDLLITSGRIEAYLERVPGGRGTEWWCLRGGKR